MNQQGTSRAEQINAIHVLNTFKDGRWMGPECVNQILYLEYSHVDSIFRKHAESQLMQSILKNAYRACKAVDSPAWDFHLYPPTTKIMFLMSYVPMVNPQIIAIKLLNKTVSLFL